MDTNIIPCIRINLLATTKPNVTFVLGLFLSDMVQHLTSPDMLNVYIKIGTYVDHVLNLLILLLLTLGIMIHDLCSI